MLLLHGWPLFQKQVLGCHLAPLLLGSSDSSLNLRTLGRQRRRRGALVAICRKARDRRLGLARSRNRGQDLCTLRRQCRSVYILSVSFGVPFAIHIGTLVAVSRGARDPRLLLAHIRGHSLGLRKLDRRCRHLCVLAGICHNTCLRLCCHRLDIRKLRRRRGHLGILIINRCSAPRLCGLHFTRTSLASLRTCGCPLCNTPGEDLLRLGGTRAKLVLLDAPVY
mmetsp:Transcript_30705/g.66007  ORF Transcript_30705/g.66007 Transcript_30705/m.66007 type:complete len:223 (-) Transcript_30705:118-786(-)